MVVITDYEIEDPFYNKETLQLTLFNLFSKYWNLFFKDKDNIIHTTPTTLSLHYIS